MRLLPRHVLGAAICIALLFGAARSQTTSFNYQGTMNSGGTSANGSHDFEFALFDAVTGGTQQGVTLTRSDVTVTNGIFSVTLDFGDQFSGANRFLEIRVRQAGGGAFTTLAPRQPLSSAPYSIKSLTADTATSAANATTAGTAANFSGSLNGDVTGTQNATTVAGLQGRSVAGTAPLGGQVLKFNSTTNQWTPDTDIVGSGGGGGTITGVTPGTGLTGGGATGNVTLGIANGGVGTTQLADTGVTDAKINTVSGSKITGTVANATDAVNAATATNSTQLGGIAANQYLQTNGNGSGLTNLNAGNVTTGILNNARLGQIPTANIADSAVTAQKVAPGQVVKSVNTLKDDVTLAAGTNITISPSGNTLTIASTSGGVGGSGTTNSIPFWSGGTTLGNSQITQSASGVQLPNNVQLAVGAQGNQMSFGSPNGETGITISGATGRADVRFDGTTLKLLAGVAGSPPTNGLFVNTTGGATITGTNGDGAVLTARRSGGDPFVIIDSTSASQNSVLAFRKGNFNRWFLYADASSESGGNLGSDFKIDAYNNAGGIANYFFVKRATGNVGFGNTNPQTRLAINGGSGWTSNGWAGSLSMGNGSALGWEANGSGQRFGIGQSNGGLYFFRTNSAFGTTSSPANYDMQITDTGNITQARDKGGLVKAMIYVDPFLPASQYIVRCYNGITNSSTGNCGFTVTRAGAGDYQINFGFTVSDRFISVTSVARGFIFANGSFAGTSTVQVDAFNVGNPQTYADAGFFLIIY